MYDTIIIGGGPAASAASIYIARKQLKALMIAESFGGQSVVSNDIDNWIGDVSISGFELAQKFEKHVKAQKNLDLKESDKVVEIQEIASQHPYPVYQVRTQAGETYETKSLILGMGAHRRKLGVPGEEAFEAKGVAYCATCDAPFFSGMKTAVVGGGNAGLESAWDLLAYADEVCIFNRSGQLKGDPATAERVKNHEKFKGVLYNTIVTEVHGEAMMNGVTYKNTETGEESFMELGGLFIEIGSIPNSDMVADLVELNERKEVLIDHKYSTTSRNGIFAAGDITDEAYKQNNISAGDAVKAALSAYDYVSKLHD